jgi:hypothetical protein
MSQVTNVILTALEYSEPEELQNKVNQYFGEHGDEYGFVHSDNVKDFNNYNTIPWYGGSKSLEADVLIGAFNYLNLQDLIIFLRSIQWDNPPLVQLIVKEQEDDLFRIINIFEK